MRWLLVIALLFDVARAQPADEADRLFQEGRALAEAGDHAAACARFADSYKLDPAVGTKLNLGDCHEHLGKLEEALALFEEAAGELDVQGEAKRAAYARERARAVRAKFVVVIVKPAEPTRAGLAIQIAGKTVAAAPEIRAVVEPGSIPIVASVPGEPPFSTTLTATGGASLTVEIPRFGAPAPRVETQQRDRGRVRLAWGLAAGGAASAITATALTLVARSNYNATADGDNCLRIDARIACNDTGRAEIRDAQRLADIGTVFATASVGLLVAGAIVYVTAPTKPVVVSPVVSGEGVGLVGRVAF